MEHFDAVFDDEIAPRLQVVTRNPKCQSFWEFLVLLTCLIIWGANFTTEAVAVLGDNTAALQDALDLKGNNQLLAVARELAWRKGRHFWAFELGHLPSEKNVVADALSRLHDSPPSAFPKQALKGARRRDCPDLRKIWKARVE